MTNSMSPSQHPAKEVRYNWTRFWVPYTGIVDLSDAGFLQDPEARFHGEGPLRTLRNLHDRPALALLGEPGIGKSAELTAEHARNSALPRDYNVASIYVNLNGFSDESRLYRRIFENAEVRAWRAGDHRLFLHLDGLDEAMLRIKTVPHLLADGIQELPTDRLSLRVASRTAVWPSATLGRVMCDLWGKSDVGILELAPLRRRDVTAALEANRIDPLAFMPRLFGAQAVPFAIKPLTLKMLIALYLRHGDLPTSTADLYRQGCLALCEESNESRLETQEQGELAGRQRLRLAGRIAVATALGNRFAVWNGPEADLPETDIAVADLASAVEEGGFASFSAHDRDVREVLNTGLFTARGDKRMGWAHQTYSEFLAANYLVEKNVAPATILAALTHPNGGLIPQLAVVGAWAASLSTEIRKALIATDPWTLLRGDLAKWTDEDLAALVDSLLAWEEAGRFHEHFFGLAETYERLNHPDLTDQLRRTLVDRSLNPNTRGTAFSIAERCKLGGLQSEALAAAMDPAEDASVRGAAVAALRTVGDASVPAQILALLRAGIGADPEAAIRGYALDYLWPDHITAQELFGSLVPTNEYYVGAFAYFLFDLPSTLKLDHFPTALTWATAYIDRSNVMGEFRNKTLTDAIMFLAWAHFETPAITGLFMHHVASRLKNHGELCRGTNYPERDKFLLALRSDADRRRLFIRELLAQPLNRQTAYPYVKNGFVLRDELRGCCRSHRPRAARRPVLKKAQSSLSSAISSIRKTMINLNCFIEPARIGRCCGIRIHG